MTDRHEQRDDAGEATTQFVMLVPTAFLLALLVIQAALLYHAANVAEAASARGAAAGSVLHGGAGDASRVALLVVADNGATLAGSPVVSMGAEFISVQVSVAVPHLVPFFPDTISRSQVEPRERFVPETER